jgi:D-galactarolactone cycloisomerase
MIRIDRLEAIVYRYPLETPVQTSFGLMVDRPMVVVKLTNHDGVIGWGEIWCNFPNVGAEHRARLAEHVIAPILIQNDFGAPEEAFDHLTDATWVLGLQTGEIGPLAQVIAGVEIALADIAGKLAGVPLWKLYGGSTDSVLVYASGINPTNPEIIAMAALNAGYKALKLKIGFGADKDTRNLSLLRNLLGAEGELMADANQAWTLDEAIAMLDRLGPFNLTWLEEPIAADRPESEWIRLKDQACMPLAAGENIGSQEAYASWLRSDILGVMQPDLAKWGGFGKTVPVARQIISSGKRYCPHYLGGGIGLVASAHALAAVGGNGMLEVDINTNPLRSELVGDLLTKERGKARLGHSPGLGYEPDLDSVRQYRVY